jgi:lysophospholipid acyltransferase 1/2
MLTIFVLPKFIRGSANEKRSQAAARTKKDDDLSSASNESINGTKKVNDVEEKDEQAISIAKSTVIEPDESSNSSSGCSSFNNSMNDINHHHIRKTDTNYLLKDLISKEVNKIKDETDNLSNLLMEKIEAANIEGLIDKTVSGIVELKDDLMRMNEPEVYSSTAVDNLRKRNVTEVEFAKGFSSAEPTTGGGVDAFLKKEIDAIKKEVTVIPAVLSNANSAK